MKTYIVGNWKMNFTVGEASIYLHKLQKRIPNYRDVEVVVAAPSLSLQSLALQIDRHKIKLGAQNAFYRDFGAFTGEISFEQLRGLVDYVIVGHSERRKYYDDSRFTNDKVKLLLDEGIIPILCIGETQDERNNGDTFLVLAKEIDDALKNIDTNLLNSVIIAYEPIWSIGTGVIPTNNDINETISFIKKHILEEFNISLKVLYGGSVNNSCINDLEMVSVIDGYLVGGCSIKKEEFEQLIKNVG